MSNARRATRIDRFSVAEDAALEALLAIEHAWERAHRGQEPVEDVWGEGPSRLRLADLGLDARLRDHALVGICQRHGEFTVEWTGFLHEEPPDFARCTATADGQRCPLSAALAPIGGLLPR